MIALCYALMGLICILLIIGVAGACFTIALIVKDLNQICEEDGENE